MSAVVRDKVKALERRRAHLRRQFTQLTETRQQLLLSQALLTAWCDCFDLLVAHAQQQVGVGALDLGADVQTLLDRERHLLEDQTAVDSSLFQEAVLPDPGIDSIAPAGDPMGLLRQCVVLGADPAAENWSALDVAGRLRETVLQCSLQWNLQQHPLVQHNAAAMKEHWDRYLHMMVSLVLLGKFHVYEAVSCYNLADLEANDPDNSEASQQRTAVLPPLLDLTEQQKDLILTAACAVDDLKQHISSQLKELQAQIAEAAAAAADASGEGGQGAAAPAPAESRGGSSVAQPPSTACTTAEAASSGASGSRSGSVPGGFQNALLHWQEQLETQQQLLARLRLLMAKESMLVFMLSLFMVGCLTYKQLSLMHVVSWPYSVRLYFLANDIRDMRQQELQEQRRRQRWQQQQEQQQQQSSEEPPGGSGQSQMSGGWSSPSLRL